MHVIKLFFTSKGKLHEVTRQRRFLCFFAFGKAWIGGQKSALEKDREGSLGTEGNITVFLIVTRDN